MLYKLILLLVLLVIVCYPRPISATSFHVDPNGGALFSVNRVLIFIAPGADLDYVAAIAAAEVGGKVIGGTDILRSRQLALTTGSYDDLAEAIKILIQNPSIEDALMDIYLPTDRNRKCVDL